MNEKRKTFLFSFSRVFESQKPKTGRSQTVSEDLKKAMVGEALYNRAHGIKQDPKLAKFFSEKEQTQAQKLSQDSPNAAVKESPSEEQKTTLSYKPPSPGRRR